MGNPEAEPHLFEWLRDVKAFRDFEAGIETKARLESKIDDLLQFFLVQGDRPSEHAVGEILACTDARRLTLWLGRAYAGETSAEMFPEPQPPGKAGPQLSGGRRPAHENSRSSRRAT